MSEQAAAWFEAHLEGLDERLRTVHLAWWGVDREEEERTEKEATAFRAYLFGYENASSVYGWPHVSYGSPEHNARREAFGLDPVIAGAEMADWPWVRMVIDDPATHVDSTASAAAIERAWTDWVRSRTLAAAPDSIRVRYVPAQPERTIGDLEPEWDEYLEAQDRDVTSAIQQDRDENRERVARDREDVQRDVNRQLYAYLRDGVSRAIPASRSRSARPGQQRP